MKLVIPPAVQSALSRIDVLALRERVLLLGASVAVLFSVWYLGFMEPLLLRAEAERKELESLQSRIEVANQNLEVQVHQLADAGQRSQRQLRRAQERIDAINDQLGGYASDLIDPAEMARVLEGVLQRQQRLRLIRIRNLGPKALMPNEEPGHAGLYMHGLEIVFEGTFMACLEYLETIEALPWRFYWQVLELETQDFPVNRIRIGVSTLSMDEEWIGA